MPESSVFQNPSLRFTAVFAVFLLLSLVVRLWLASRQIRCVAAHRNAVPGGFAAQVPLAAHRKAADYTIVKTRFGMLELLLGSAVLLGWTLLGGLDWLNQSLFALMGGGMWQQLALLGGFALISAAIDLPAGWYQTFVIEERFGFNRMTLKLWLGDLLKSALLGVAMGLPIAALILWLMGAAGRFWWLWAWGVWMGFNVLMMVVYPTFIAPLFNKFRPLEDEAMKARITALLQRCGFSVSGLFVMDGSRRSAHGNAYFTGFGAARRVVFYDTLLQRLESAEMDAVLAHELGHFRHRHIAKRMALVFALSLAGFALLGWLAQQQWFYTGLGVMPAIGLPNDALALLLFLLAAPVFTFFISPLMAQLSRRDEFQADAYAVEQTSGADLRRALLKLFEDNASTLTPDPVYAAFYYSHPPASERLARLPGQTA